MPPTKKLKPTDILKMIYVNNSVETFVNTNSHTYMVTKELPYHAIAVNSNDFNNYFRAKYSQIEHEQLRKQREEGDSQAPISNIPNLTMNAMSEFAQWVLSQSSFEAEKQKIWLRCAKKDDHIYYDIGDGKNVVEFNGKGTWTLVNAQNRAKVYFRKNVFKANQVLPDPKAKIEDIFLLDKYLNIQNKSDRKIFYAYLVSSLHPTISMMILNIHGIKGSTKTTTFRLLKSLIDPSPIPSHPSIDGSLIDDVYNRDELMQRTSQHYCLYLDNISYVQGWLSDALARISTGSVMSSRQLYTDNDYIIYDDRPILGINGINLTTTAPDVLQRSLILEIDRPKRRISDLNLWTEFRKEKPKILGGIMATFAKALTYYGTIKLDSKRTPRMADYAEFSAAVAKSLGYDVEKYLILLQNNTDNQNMKGVENSPTAICLMKYIETILTKQEVKLVDLWKEVSKKADEFDYKVGRKADEFPSTSTKFGKELNKVIGNLYEMGYQIYKTQRKIDGQYYVIEPYKKPKEQEDEWDKLLETQ